MLWERYRKVNKLNITTKALHRSSAHVFLHHFGLCFLRKAVDSDGDVCVFEHLFQYHGHFVPRQSIQATTDTVGERERKKNVY